MINLTKVPFSSLDALAARFTAFKTFSEMLAAPVWWPSLCVDSAAGLKLANAYDEAQAAAGDKRRADRWRRVAPGSSALPAVKVPRRLVALSPMNQCMDSRRGVLVVVLNSCGGVVSADIEWAESMEARRASLAGVGEISGWRVVEVPLLQALASSALVTFMRRLSDGGHGAGDLVAECAGELLASLGE